VDKLTLYRELKDEIEDEEYVESVQLDEDFVTPDKSAAFTPYDAVICIEDDIENYENDYSGGPSLNRIIDRNSNEKVENKVKEMLEDVDYEEINGITENSMSELGDYLVYISLHVPEWIDN
jgi:hypothetical protein